MVFGTTQRLNRNMTGFGPRFFDNSRFKNNKRQFKRYCLQTLLLIRPHACFAYVRPCNTKDLSAPQCSVLSRHKLGTCHIGRLSTLGLGHHLKGRRTPPVA